MIANHRKAGILYLFFGLFLLMPCSCKRGNPSMLEKVKQLNLQTIEGNIKTYYPEGYENSAMSSLAFLSESISFYEQNFKVRQSFALAILDSNEWVTITDIPYGLPFVSGPPYVVCLPANSKNILSEIILEACEGYEVNMQNALTKEEMVNLFVSFIGFHELGHIYASEYGISFPNKWIFEFAATYFAYDYLENNFPEHSRLWVELSGILAKELEPSKTSLNDFEELYVKVGVENYAWYQVVFLARVAEVYKQHGTTFPEKLKKQQWPANSTSIYLNEMESLSSGFMSWAKDYHLFD